MYLIFQPNKWHWSKVYVSSSVKKKLGKFTLSFFSSNTTVLSYEIHGNSGQPTIILCLKYHFLYKPLQTSNQTTSNKYGQNFLRSVIHSIESKFSHRELTYKDSHVGREPSAISLLSQAETLPVMSSVVISGQYYNKEVSWSPKLSKPDPNWSLSPN